MRLRTPLEGSCRATVTAFSFATFSQRAQSGLRSQGFVSFNCPSPVAEIDLDAGTSGDFSARTMVSLRGGQAAIVYNIYLDAACTIVFGNGEAGSSAYVPPAGTSAGSFPLYAEIAPGQSRLPASGYSDTLNITVRLVQ